MRKSTIWGLALATVAVSSAVAASAISPALTRDEGEVAEENQVVYLLDPASESIVTDLMSVNITFPDVTGIIVNDKMPNVAVLTNTVTKEEYICEYPDRNVRVAEGVSFTFNFISSEADNESEESRLVPITTPGTYELVIKPGAFLYGEEVEDADGNISIADPQPTQEITATYTVVEGTPDVAYILDPASESIVTDLQTVTITFPENKGVQVNDKMSKVVLTDIESGKEYICDYPLLNTRAGEGTSFILNFISEEADPESEESQLVPINTPGTYELVITKGTFLYGDEEETEDGVVVANPTPVQSITATYTVVEGTPDVDYVLDPASESIVTDLQTVTITFPEIKGVQVNDKMSKVVLTDIESGKEYICDYPLLNTRVAEGTSFILNFISEEADPESEESQLVPINTPGTYELVITKGTFLYGDEEETEDGVVVANPTPVQAITATYTVVEGTPEVAYILDPASESIVTDLQTVTITFPEIKGVQVNDKMSKVVLTDIESGKEYICDYPLLNTRAGEGTSFILNFISEEADPESEESQLVPINTPGTYELVITKGTFLYGDEEETEEGVELANMTPVQSITATYTVVEGTPEVAYVLDPESESVVTDLQTVTITFPEIKGVQVNDKMSKVVLTDIESGKEYICDYPLLNTRAGEGTSFILNFISEEADPESEESQLVPINTPGTYELVITKGTFLYGDEEETEEGVELANMTPVQSITATYTVVEGTPEVAYILEPESESVVTDLQTVTITFPEIKGVQVNDKMSKVILKNVETEEEYICDYPLLNTRVAEGTSFILNFISEEADPESEESRLVPINTPGTYELVIPVATFLYGDEKETEEGVELTNMKPVQAITATYTVVEGLPEVAYVLDPEAGSYVKDLQTVTISFPEIKGVQVNDKMSKVILKNVETEEEYICDYPLLNPRAGEGTTFTLNFISEEADPESEESLLVPITTPGTYELVIPVATFLYGDEEETEEGVELTNVKPVQAITATYTIAEPVPEIAYLLDPASDSTVESLATIHLTFPTTKGVQVNDKMPFPVVLKNITTNEEYVCDYPLRDTREVEGTAFILNFISIEADSESEESMLLPINTPGTYEMIVKEGAFFYGEEVEDEEGVTIPNPIAVQEIKATYIITDDSSVLTIFDSEEVVFDVYNVNGIQILKAADADAVNALPNGLYIINGKKVLIKK